MRRLFELQAKGMLFEVWCQHEEPTALQLQQLIKKLEQLADRADQKGSSRSAEAFWDLHREDQKGGSRS